jgi:hypothetical protein
MMTTGLGSLPGGDVSLADAMLVSLYCMISRDSSLAELADLPDGWEASRRANESECSRSPKAAVRGSKDMHSGRY